MIKLLHGDCRALLARMEAESVDAVVTDPPYGLGFMGKEFDKLGEGEAQEAFHRTWARELLRVLKPGGHVIAFGGTRTYHWLAAALEKEGFEIRDMVSWAYGSGFPKSLDVGKAIDKIDRLGPMQERALAFTAWMRGTGITVAKVNAVTGTFMGSHYLTDKEQPAVPTEELFDLLRPHLPPVPAEIEALVASRTVERENMRRREVVGERTVPVGHAFAGEVYGRDGSASTTVPITLPHTEAAQRWHGWGTALKPAVEPAVLARKPLVGTVAANVLAHGTGAVNVDGCRVGEENAPGRWPANLIHDGSPEVVGLFPVTKSGEMKGEQRGWGKRGIYGEGGLTPATSYADEGSAARFFYCAKAANAERPDVAVCDCLAGALPMRHDGPVGETCPTCQRPTRKLAHPTVKPLALMEYLIRMVLPPGGVVLDPFAGSGSTLVAAQRMGVDAIGIEKEAEYIVIARSRLEPA